MSEPTPPFPLTRETTIRVDRDGQFWHDGQRLEHPGLQRAFASWVDVDPESGRWILRNAINWAFITVDDAPLVVTSLGEDERGRVTLTLTDGTVEPLDARTLRLDADDVPYCDVRGGKIPARFGRQAAIALLERAHLAGDAVVLAVDGGDLTIPRVPRGEGARRR